MEKVLRTGIKELISAYPEIGEILSRYEIGCVTCSVGTCLLRDVVEVHGLSDEREYQLFGDIAHVLFPGRRVPIPKTTRRFTANSKGIAYSPPMKTLVEEHTLIKRVLALIPLLTADLDLSSAAERETVHHTLDFIRSYADKFHHAKEEDILFRYFDHELEILKAMEEEHNIGRSHVKETLQALENGDVDGVTRHLDAYKELLVSHIKKEDEVLYPWMDAKLSLSDTGELFARFSAVDAEFKGIASGQEAFVNNLEQGLKYKEETSNV